MSRANAADPVSQVHAIDAARSLYRPMVNGEDDTVPLSQRHDLHVTRDRILELLNRLDREQLRNGLFYV